MTEITPDPHPPTAHGERPKIVYLMGTARSGSTILGVTLGNCESVFYAGELGGWLVKSGISWLDGADRARFWSTVRGEVPGAEELFGKEARSLLEVSTAAFRVHKWPARRRVRRRYRRVAADLYLAIARTAGAGHVVDSSSHPLRARELRGLGEIDLYLVYMARDPQSVVASFTSPGLARYSRSVVTTNAYIWFTNLLSVLVFLSHPRNRRVFVRYEDFVTNPEGVLGQILRRIDVSGGLPDLSALRTGLPFQGNRLLRGGEVITFKRDAGPPPRWSRVTTLFQLPWRIVLSRLQPAARVLTSSRTPPGRGERDMPMARSGK